MDEAKRIASGEYTFEVIDEIPCGYEFWNIGKNMTEGYLPLCRLSAIQPFEGGRCVDVESLKAIKLDGAQIVLAASVHGQTTVEAMEKYLARYQGKRVSESVLRQIKRIEAALDVLKEIRRPAVPVKRMYSTNRSPNAGLSWGTRLRSHIFPIMTAGMMLLEKLRGFIRTNTIQKGTRKTMFGNIRWK